MVKALLIIVITMAIVYIPVILYHVTGVGKRFYHDILGWHKPDGKESFDGCSCHSTCKYCGKEILQDSQGNWF